MNIYDYKDFFVKQIILANIQINEYLENKVTLSDYDYLDTKGFGGDNPLKLDLIFEKIFIKHLNKLGNIYSEECGFIDNKSDITFIIDPLDGSNNFYSNLPYYGTSVAIKHNEIIVAGFVANLVSKIITYKIFDEETKNFSLKLNKYFHPIKLNQNKIAIFERAYDYPNICTQISNQSIKYRSLGAVALSLCDASNYNFVLYIGNVRQFDVEASLYVNSDLYLYRTKNCILLSKYKDKFILFKEIINQY